jgi:hypothetical protein
MLNIKTKLTEAHERENELNKQLGKLDAIIRNAQKKKKVLARKISVNMKYRNGLVNRLSEWVVVLSDDNDTSMSD